MHALFMLCQERVSVNHLILTCTVDPALNSPDGVCCVVHYTVHVGTNIKSVDLTFDL